MTCSRKLVVAVRTVEVRAVARVPWVMVTRGCSLLTTGVGHGRCGHARNSDCGLSLRLAASQLLHLALLRSTGVIAGFLGFSALVFLREARFDFLRSSLVSFSVFAMMLS